MATKTKPVPFSLRVRPGNEKDLEAQLQLSRREDLSALLRRRLAWAQFSGRGMPETEARIRALEISLRTD